MDLRDATQEDAKELIDLLVLCNGEEYRKLAQNYIACMFSHDLCRPHFVVAEENGKIIGTAAFSEEMFTVGVYGISWVSVSPAHRNGGIGESLIRKCLSCITLILREEGTVILLTYPEKTGLYDKIGFKKSGQDAAGGWFMTLFLKPKEN